jgi:hypothetical protein
VLSFQGGAFPEDFAYGAQTISINGIKKSRHPGEKNTSQPPLPEGRGLETSLG